METNKGFTPLAMFLFRHKTGMSVSAIAKFYGVKETAVFDVIYSQDCKRISL